MSGPGKLVYSMAVSLDGFVAGPDGDFQWSRPDEELHRFHNERVGRLSAHLLGRKLYETMVYWETEDPDWGAVEVEFAGIWQALPKVVFSSTLTEVEGNNRLATGSVEEEVARLKSEHDGEIGVGGPTLAAACIELDLIDRYELFVSPIIVGGGLPFFPALESRSISSSPRPGPSGTASFYIRYQRPG